MDMQQSDKKCLRIEYEFSFRVDKLHIFRKCPSQKVKMRFWKVMLPVSNSLLYDILGSHTHTHFALSVFQGAIWYFPYI